MGITVNKETNTMWISGVLVKCTYAPLIKGKDKNGNLRYSEENYYQFAFAVSAVDAERVREDIGATYYGSAEAQYIPKWVKGEESPDENGNIILNFKSRYDIYYFLGDDRLSYDDLTDRYGGRAPLGSKVTANIALKDGAMYVKAIRFDEIKEIKASDFF